MRERQTDTVSPSLLLPSSGQARRRMRRRRKKKRIVTKRVKFPTLSGSKGHKNREREK